MYSAIRSMTIITSLILIALAVDQSTLAQRPDDSQKLVWYASYGSNLRSTRFDVYIDPNAPLPPGLSAEHHGCRDTRRPRESKPVTFDNFELYFADENRTVRAWDGAAAFIRKRAGSHVLGRMYLISYQQFNDVVLQENSKGEKLEDKLPSLESIIKTRGFSLKQVFPDALYDQILYIGNQDGHPIFSFTTSNKTLVTGAPSGPYLQQISLGLHETYPAKQDADIYHYLAAAPGIRGPVDSEKLRRLSKQPNPVVSAAH